MLLKRKNETVFIGICLILVINSGWCLDCFVCHSKEDRDCADPFDGNRTVSCQRVREVGVGLISGLSALGAKPGPFQPLGHPPHVCFKLNLGNFQVRGCGRTEFCVNYTETNCTTCNEDGCNSSYENRPLMLLILFTITSPWILIQHKNN